MTIRHRYTRTLDERVERLAERWILGALIIHLGGGIRGVIVQAADEIAARWNDGRPGHIALIPLRDRPAMGGMVYVRWEDGDACWCRVDVLQLVDRAGVYRVWEDRPGDAPVYRLAVQPGDQAPTWWAARELPTGWRWATRAEADAGNVLAGAA
ncbi:hypothetical protein [Sphaerisporangium sp. NPDC051011]|uniref:hypothetical protein n=1 Tax=Sphaerisporangium sp. NPDC051011 TaxID=3155792 RepID=UPI0033F43D83